MAPFSWKFCANLGFFGQRRDRFTQYQPPRSLDEKLALAAGVQGLSGVELVYPVDFENPAQVGDLLEKHGLGLAAVNVNIKDAEYFRHGSLAARDPAARRKAVEMLRTGMDLAAEFRAGLVTTCPVMDGYDYPFQLDYLDAWGSFVDSVRQAVAHRADVSLLLEYQPNDPNAHILLRDVGRVLYVCAEVGAPNLGANLDVGHAFAAGESPAEAACLLASKGLLRYIHTNDNTGDGSDWDMISGSVHFWHWLEFLYTLERLGYTGWLGGDISPRHFGPREAYQSNLDLIQSMTALLHRTGADKIAACLREDGGFQEVYRLFMEEMNRTP